MAPVGPVNPFAQVVIESSWEVCNKVGGIYTVLASKAHLMQQYYDEYYVVGPWLEGKSEFEFEERAVPDNLCGVFDELSAQGVPCRFGAWQIKGEPLAILVDYRNLTLRMDEFKAWLWDRFGIDSLRTGWGFDEPVVWSYAVSLLLEKLARGPFSSKRFVSHHHEWMAGLSLLFCKGRAVPIKTVFTTHATMLGRSIAGNGQDLYGMLDSLDPQAKAYELGVQDKFLTERACAQECDVFTTVSEITALEAQKILGRKPEVLVLNGFDLDRFPTIEETSIKHVTSRERLREFLTYHFFPYYSFDLDHNLMLCISGRYEFGNKGVDVLIRALDLLNDRLKSEGALRTVTVFFWIPNGTTGVRTDVLENKNYYRHLKGYVDWHGPKILKRIVDDFITSDDPGKDVPYTAEFMKQMKRDVLHFRRQGNPPLCTHNLLDESTDPLMQALYASGLKNAEGDKVKVVAYPAYLDGADGVLDLSYYDALAGTHFALFPSYYEPWGYTPLEAAAMAVPTLTTDVAGFGRFIRPSLQRDHPGIFVIDRFENSFDDVVGQLVKVLYDFISLDRAERVQNKINAKQLSMLADWKHMVKRYVQAHNLALENK